MLQRAAELTEEEDVCDDPLVMSACVLDDESCPAQCREEEDNNADEDNKVVLAGDLKVTAEANEGASVISQGATSELDTLKFRTSEDISLRSITVERYGLSSSTSVASIRLEDAEGNKITSEKAISQSKDTATLSLKKDYQNISDGDYVVIVMSTPVSPASALGTNIGFKVIAVDSSAENVDLGKYKANLYNFIDYAGNTVKVSFKGSNKPYNYEEGKFYEVSKVRLVATNAAVLVNGFTLKQDGSLDLDKYVDEVEVSVDGKALKSKASIKRDELKVSFDEQEIAINKNSTFTVSVSLKDFDVPSSTIKLGLAAGSDVDVSESKNAVKVKVAQSDGTTPIPDAGLYGYVYTFNGGKINLTNEKLASTINAAAGSSDVVIAEGKISIGGQPVSLKTLNVTPTTTITAGGSDYQYIESLRLIVNGEEYEADSSWNFKNIVIEEDSNIKLVADIKDLRAADEAATINVSFSVTAGAAAFNKTTLAAIRYDEISGDAGAAASNLVGTINISAIKVQPAKGTLTVDSNKKVEFIVSETSDEVSVFKGSYSAKNDVNLDNVRIRRLTTGGDPKTEDDITFTVKIDGKAVATLANPGELSVSYNGEDASFSPIAVKAGKSVPVEVVAVVYASDKTTSNLEYKLEVSGKDNDGNAAGIDGKAISPLAFVEHSTINASTNDTIKMQDLVLANKGQTLAKFYVKPSNKGTKANLDLLTFTVNEALDTLIPASADAEDYFEVLVGNNSVDTMNYNSSTRQLTVTDIDTDISEDTMVTVNFKDKLSAATAGASHCSNGTEEDAETCVKADYNAHRRGKWDYSYTLVTTEPEDFTTNYGNYYKKVSEEYVQLTSSELWGAGSYYTRSATESCINGDGTTKEACEAASYDAHTQGTWEATIATYEIALSKINGGDDLGSSYLYTRHAVNSIVRVASMKGDKESSTKYTFAIEYSDDANSEKINSVEFSYATAIAGYAGWTNVQEGKTYSVDNGSSVNYVQSITYTDGDNYTVTIPYIGNEDFFTIGNGDHEDRLKAFKDD